MCLGCLFAGFAAAFPRVGLLIIWIFTDWVDKAFKGNWFWPLLGIIFLPLTTLMYVLVDISTPGSNIHFGGWLLIGLAAVYDVMHWVQIGANRENSVALYNQYSR